MKRTSKVIALLLSLAMVLSVCGMLTVFAEGEYTVKTGTNNMIRIENAAEHLEAAAGVARTYQCAGRRRVLCYFGQGAESRRRRQI